MSDLRERIVRAIGGDIFDTPDLRAGPATLFARGQARDKADAVLAAIADAGWMSGRDAAIRADNAYLNGMRQGWNFACAGAEDRYSVAQNKLRAEIRAARTEEPDNG